LDPLFVDPSSLELDSELVAWQGQIEKNKRSVDPGDVNILAAPGERNIYLTKGYVAIINEFQYHKVSGLKYYANVQKSAGKVYAVRNVVVMVGGLIKKRTKRYLHQDMMEGELPVGLIDGENPPKIVIDHANGNGLDNRWRNLTITSQELNQLNVPVKGDSGYRGVSWRGDKRRRWEVRVALNGERKYLGSYQDPVAAASAYDRALLDHLSKNFPGISASLVASTLNFPENYGEQLEGFKRAQEERFREMEARYMANKSREEIPF
jgi:hypothetical protein